MVLTKNELILLASWSY